ncbi:MAG: phosphotriesterase [Firmicutes bacterium]|jgi:phosphotriesterase-related protein|nr:phosphotriesterase [Bacillota bacterium]
MSKQIMTVLGPIAPEELGLTSMHDHIFMDGGWVLRKRREELGTMPPKNPFYSADDPVTLENIGLIRKNMTSNWDALSLEDEEMMLGEVQDFMLSGGKGLVEMSVPGIRHKVPAIKKIAEATGLNIVICTGLYTADSWSDKYLSMSEKELIKFMLDEIKYGVEDTGILPGHIKIAIHDMNVYEERVLRAAAKVANQTGFSMTIHCGSTIGGDGRRVARILKEEEMDLSRAVIAHAAGSLRTVRDLKTQVLHPELVQLSLDYCKELMDFGINISLEFYNGPSSVHWVVLAGIVALLKQGYSHQIVSGCDVCAKVHTRRGGAGGYNMLTDFAMPTLRQCGVSDYDLRMMAVENPARILAYDK